LLANSLYQLFKYLAVRKEIKNNWPFITQSEKLNNNSEKRKFFILCPVLHEEGNIEKLLESLASQTEYYPRDLFEVYIITTEKETLSDESPNTIEVFESVQGNYSNLYLTRLHYPSKEGYKADQLSFCFNKIKSEYPNQIISESLFLFLDADSEIDSSMLDRYMNTFEKGVRIYQQPLLWFKNFSTLPSPFMKSFSFIQSFFSLSYEIPMFRDEFFPWRLRHLVGHGLCVQGSFLLEIGGIPDFMEDVRMGRLSSFLSEKVKVVPGFGMVETAKNITVWIKQVSVWFTGMSFFLSDWRHAVAVNSNRSCIRDCILMLYGFFKHLRWLNQSLFHLIGLALSTLFMSLPLLAIFLCSLLLSSTVPVILVANDFREIIHRKIEESYIFMVFISALLSPIMYILNFLGVYLGLYRFIKFRICHRLTLPKTER
jgi:glycosyltransferase involved in cell wall biosynthesis